MVTTEDDAFPWVRPNTTADILHDGIDPDIVWESQPFIIQASWWCARHAVLMDFSTRRCDCADMQPVEVRVYEV